MKDKTILTAESVTAGHPDKLCDTIADTVVDCCLEHDPNAASPVKFWRQRANSWWPARLPH